MPLRILDKTKIACLSLQQYNASTAIKHQLRVFVARKKAAHRRSVRAIEARCKMQLARIKYLEKIAQLRNLQSLLFRCFTYRVCFFCFLIVPRLSINCLLQSFSFSFFAYTCCAIATLCPITSASSCALSILYTSLTMLCRIMVDEIALPVFLNVLSINLV